MFSNDVFVVVSLAVSALGDSDGKPGGRGPRCRRTTDDTIAAFSNYGSSVNVTAPGGMLFRTSRPVL